MATTCQLIVTRAAAWSTANVALTNDTAEMLNRIAADERALFDLAASLNTYYFAVAVAVASSSGSSGRTVVTTGLTYPVGRLLTFVLTSGAEVRQVDLRDTDAELAPRYYLLGTTITEVSNDWSASAGSVGGTLTYVKRPTVITTTGALSQTVTLPDEFVDLLDLKLALYLAHKDYGRDVAEIKRLADLIAGRTEAFVAFLTSFGGPEHRAFNLPATGHKR